MPRAKSHTTEAIVTAAMQVFWRRGYEGTSMDDLVRETKISRAALYSAHPGKQALFLACLEAYGAAVVSAAFAPVEKEGATLDQVAAYFEAQIASAEQLGLPGPGCLMANNMTERAPHDPAVLARVCAHNVRLQEGFLNALRGEAQQRGAEPQEGALSRSAEVLTIFANGLWSSSRQTSDAAALRRSVSEILNMTRERVLR